MNATSNVRETAAWWACVVGFWLFFGTPIYLFSFGGRLVYAAFLVVIITYLLGYLLLRRSERKVWPLPAFSVVLFGTIFFTILGPIVPGGFVIIFLPGVVFYYIAGGVFAFFAGVIYSALFVLLRDRARALNSSSNLWFFLGYGALLGAVAGFLGVLGGDFLMEFRGHVTAHIRLARHLGMDWEGLLTDEFYKWIELKRLISSGLLLIGSIAGSVCGSLFSFLAMATLSHHDVLKTADSAA